jgi:hypothetical protein
MEEWVRVEGKEGGRGKKGYITCCASKIITLDLTYN